MSSTTKIWIKRIGENLEAIAVIGDADFLFPFKKMSLSQQKHGPTEWNYSSMAKVRILKFNFINALIFIHNVIGQIERFGF